MAARASRSRASVRVRRGGAGTRASVRARRPRSEITATRRASVGTTRLATLRAGRAGVSGATLDRYVRRSVLLARSVLADVVVRITESATFLPDCASALRAGREMSAPINVLQVDGEINVRRRVNAPMVRDVTM